jgi:hypothetical protein
MMARQYQGFLQQNNSTSIYAQQQTIGPSAPTMMTWKNQAFLDKVMPN